jgi:hypothetical protein
MEVTVYRAIISSAMCRMTPRGEQLAIDFDPIEGIGSAYIDITFGTFELDLVDPSIRQIVTVVGAPSWDALEGTEVRLRRDGRGLVALGNAHHDRWFDIFALIGRVRGPDRDDDASALLGDVDEALRRSHGDMALFARQLGEAAIAAAGRFSSNGSRSNNR